MGGAYQEAGVVAFLKGPSGNNRVISKWRTHSCVPRRHSCRRLASSTRTGVEMSLDTARTRAKCHKFFWRRGRSCGASAGFGLAYSVSWLVG